MIVGVVVGAIVLIVIIGVVVYRYKKGKQANIQVNEESDIAREMGKQEEENLQETQIYNLNNVKVIYG